MDDGDYEHTGALLALAGRIQQRLRDARGERFTPETAAPRVSALAAERFADGFARVNVAVLDKDLPSKGLTAGIIGVVTWKNVAPPVTLSRRVWGHRC